MDRCQRPTAVPRAGRRALCAAKHVGQHTAPSPSPAPPGRTTLGKGLCSQPPSLSTIGISLRPRGIRHVRGVHSHGNGPVKPSSYPWYNKTHH